MKFFISPVAPYARPLKVPFARPCCFYENLKERHLPKIGTIGARVARRDCDAHPSLRESATQQISAAIGPRHAGAARVNASFTMQRIVHHSTRRSPCRANGYRGRAQLAPIVSAEYRCGACLSVRLSGV
jgi:hypothetical protein